MHLAREEKAIDLAWPSPKKGISCVAGIDGFSLQIFHFSCSLAYMGCKQLGLSGSPESPGKYGPKNGMTHGKRKQPPPSPLLLQEALPGKHQMLASLRAVAGAAEDLAKSSQVGEAPVALLENARRPKEREKLAISRL